MRPSLSPLNFINDSNKLNLTAHELKDFLEASVKHAVRNATAQNKTLAKLSNDTLDLSDCIGYCDSSRLRHVFEEYKHYHGYVSLVICIFGTIANILNIIILTRKEMTKTPINAILKWLAVCDMFVMIEYIPFTWHTYLANEGGPDLSYGWAAYLLFHSNFSQILHTISISLTVTLAVWRYIAIKHPHGSLGFFAQNHHGAAIFFSFILSPILCLPTFFAFNIREHQENGQNKYHLDANEDSKLYSINFWIHSVIIKLLPCCILTIISFVLIDVLCRANKRKMKLKGYSQAAAAPNGAQRPSRMDRRTDRTTMLLVAVLLLFLLTEFPQGILGLLSGIMGKCFLHRCYLMFAETMDLLALINAAVGFVLYGSMSKQFRITFKSLFLQRRVQNLEMTRVTNINNTTTNV